MFATVSLENVSSGATLTVEFVCETSNAWQVAVKGKVRLLLKDEWKSVPNPPIDYSNLLNDLRRTE